MYALPVWDRDEEKVILNLNSNPNRRRLDQKLAGKDTGRGQSETRVFYPHLSQVGKTVLCTHQRLACCAIFPGGSRGPRQAGTLWRLCSRAAISCFSSCAPIIKTC